MPDFSVAGYQCFLVVERQASSQCPTNYLTKYDANMTNTAGVVFTEDAVASVQLLGLAMESEYDIRRQGTLILGKYALGHSEFLPKAAVALNTA